MKFEEDTSLKTAGMWAGYLVSYCLFTAFLYLVGIYFQKFPEGWNVMHIIAITAIISALGEGMRRWLS